MQRDIHDITTTIIPAIYNDVNDNNENDFKTNIRDNNDNDDNDDENNLDFNSIDDENDLEYYQDDANDEIVLNNNFITEKLNFTDIIGTNGYIEYKNYIKTKLTEFKDINNNNGDCVNNIHSIEFSNITNNIKVLIENHEIREKKLNDRLLTKSQKKAYSTYIKYINGDGEYKNKQLIAFQSGAGGTRRSELIACTE